MGAVQLIMFSAFDMEAFLPIARQAMGYGLSGKADGQAPCEEVHNMMCVAGMVNGEAADVDHLYYAAYLVACDERDMPDVLSVAGMPHISVDSSTRGVRVAIISGSLPEWRNALRKGCAEGCESNVRKVYNRVYNDLTKRRLDGILGATSRRRQHTDNTFLLEYKS